MTELRRDEVLCIPKRRRLVHSKLKSPEGQVVLHLFYGGTEIVFDEPELVPFGDKLLEADRFRAEDAMAWSSGAPHAWERVRELLEALLEHEILARFSEAATSSTAQAFPLRLGAEPSALEPRTFSAHDDRCPVITERVFGRALELSNLEAVVPVYRVAHATLDRDGRQLGENNVTPRALFLDLPTERRTCKYAGSRYQAELPMNITALRYMTKRWPELLSLTEQFRSAFLSRLPMSPLCVGDAHLLTVSCLASVGYVMVRGEAPVPNGELDAGLGAMFRLVDGVRLVTTEMMRAAPDAHGCDQPIDAARVAEHAERFTAYHGQHGVCAGPPALIEEYLRVLLDGVSAPIHVEPDVATRLGDLEAAIDYGLHGQRIEALLKTFGALQGLHYERLRSLAQKLPVTPLRELLERPITSERHPLLRDTHPLRETLELELSVNRWLHARAGAALGGTAETLDALLQHPSVDHHGLADFFAHATPASAGLSGACGSELAAVAAEVFALERRCLRALAREQDRLNARLRRRSGPKLGGSDLAIFTEPRTGPSLAATLSGALGITITTDARASVLSARGHRITLTD